VILKKERFLNAILLEFAELDNQANGAGQRLLDDEILLPSNLCTTAVSTSLSLAAVMGAFMSAYRLQQSKQFSLRLVGDFASIDRLGGGICSHHISNKSTSRGR
jgi:hypothetical protein